jgi:hypothetical protein
MGFNSAFKGLNIMQLNSNKGFFCQKKNCTASWKEKLTKKKFQFYE